MGSWTGTGHKKDQTTIKVYLASSKHMKVNEVSPNDHSDFLGQGYTNMAAYLSHVENFYNCRNPGSILHLPTLYVWDLLKTLRHKPTDLVTKN